MSTEEINSAVKAKIDRGKDFKKENDDKSFSKSLGNMKAQQAMYKAAQYDIIFPAHNSLLAKYKKLETKISRDKFAIYALLTPYLFLTLIIMVRGYANMTIGKEFLEVWVMMMLTTSSMVTAALWFAYTIFQKPNK